MSILTEKKHIKVLIVDDSDVVCKLFARQLSCDESIQVVGTAPDPYVARDKIISLRPDVLTLDIEMPRMDGLTFLKKLMKHHPMPVIIVSSLTRKGCDIALEAIECGAVDVLCKPANSAEVVNLTRDLIDKIKAASKTQLKHVRLRSYRSETKTLLKFKSNSNKILAIGASTGGVTALTTILQTMPVETPGTVIVQHMPEKFTASFADRLNKICAIEVKEAEDGDLVIPGRAIIAPGGMHMLLRKIGNRYNVQLRDGPRVFHQKPSVEVLFQSVAQVAGANAVGAILTGMGADGARGLLLMRNAGAHTIAQDEASCTVFGMPKEAIAMGAAEKIVPLDRVAMNLLNFAAY